LVTFAVHCHSFADDVKVRWDDVGLNGRLRYTRYSEYAATARLGFLASKS
jgi:acyl-CoA thioester hydrolase